MEGMKEESYREEKRWKEKEKEGGRKGEEGENKKGVVERKEKTEGRRGERNKRK